tara:strand:- start:328 stop:1050 length:723 start_codon:yes stop_codon:yes gene_type:complete
MKKISIIGGGIVASNFIEKISKSKYYIYKYLPTSRFEKFNEIASKSCHDKKVIICSNINDLSDSDLIISSGNHLIIKKEFLEENNVINFHAAPLPKYGGSAGPAFSLINNEQEFGFTFQKMTPFLDEGPIIYCDYFEIKDNMNSFDIDALAIEKGTNYLIKAIDKFFEEKDKLLPLDIDKLIIHKRDQLNKYRFIPIDNLKMKKSIQIIKALTWPGILEPAYTLLNSNKIYLTFNNIKEK